MPLLPRSRLSTWILLSGVLLLAGLYAVWLWTDALTDLGGDSAGYLIISRLYSPYHAASAATLAFKNAIITPPLFPLLLTLVDGGYHFLAAHLLVGGFAVASSIALYWWLSNEGFRWWIAALVALLFAILPITMQTAFNIWTEFPYLFFSMAAIALLTRTPNGPTRTDWYGAAAMVACSCLIRVAALPLLAAFLLYLALRRPGQWLAMALTAALPFIIWALYSSLNERGAGSYVNHFVDVYAGDPVGKLIMQCRIEYGAVFHAWKTGWLQYSSSGELHGIVTGFWYVCIVGWLVRLVRLKFDAIYGLLYLAELFMWPHPEEAARYSFVLYPLFIGSGFLLLALLPKRMAEPGGRPYLTATAVVVMLLTVLPAAVHDLDLFNADIPPEIEAARHTQDWYTNSRYYAVADGYYYQRLFRHIGAIGEQVAPGECVYAIKPTLVTLFADRTGEGPPKISAGEAQFNAEIGKCRYAYVLPFPSPSFPQALYPMDRLGTRAKILSRLEGASGNIDGALIEIQPAK